MIKTLIPFLFNCESSFLSLISELNKYGKKESALPWLKIGQGLNITKDYAVTASQININIDTLIPYLNVDECGYYDWNKSSTLKMVKTYLNWSKMNPSK